MDWETLVVVIAILKERKRAIMLGPWGNADETLLLNEVNETISVLVKLREELRH